MNTSTTYYFPDTTNELSVEERVRQQLYGPQTNTYSEIVYDSVAQELTFSSFEPPFQIKTTAKIISENEYNNQEYCFCSNCGNKIKKTANFCNRCGSPNVSD